MSYIALCLRRLPAARPRAALTLLCLALLVPATASAAPTFTYKSKALPIPGFPGTGNVLGAGAIIQFEGVISGSEYGGFPPPLTQIRYWAPVGAKLHPQGFATCAPALIERTGPGPCPKKSVAGPKGSALGEVAFGGERVPETASVQPFFAPGGGLEAFVQGVTPVLVEVLAVGKFVELPPPSSIEFSGEVPLIETVPGAPDASFMEGVIRVGAAYRRGKRMISYVTIPPRCPKGGWPTKIQLSFLGGAIAEASYAMPCPKG
jgi:hypothetical protein